MEKNGVRLGKINCHVQEVIGNTFASDLHIYGEGPAFLKLAHAHPNNLEKCVCQMALIFKNPDYLAFCHDKMEIYFIKEYLEEKGFKKVVVKIHFDKIWLFDSLEVLTSDTLQALRKEAKVLWCH